MGRAHGAGLAETSAREPRGVTPGRYLATVDRVPEAVARGSLWRVSGRGGDSWAAPFQQWFMGNASKGWGVGRAHGEPRGLLASVERGGARVKGDDKRTVRSISESGRCAPWPVPRGSALWEASPTARCGLKGDWRDLQKASSKWWQGGNCGAPAGEEVTYGP